MGATRPTQMLRERALLSSGRTQDTHENEPPTRRFSSISRRFGVRPAELRFTLHEFSSDLASLWLRRAMYRPRKS